MGRGRPRKKAHAQPQEVPAAVQGLGQQGTAAVVLVAGMDGIPSKGTGVLSPTTAEVDPGETTKLSQGRAQAARSDPHRTIPRECTTRKNCARCDSVSPVSQRSPLRTTLAPGL